MPDVDTPARRRAAIRRALIRGHAPAEVIRMITEGYLDPDTGEFWQVTRETVRKDLRTLAQEWADALQDPAELDAIMFGVAEQLQAVATEARKAGDFGPAIRALVELQRMLGLRSPRWDRRNRDSSRHGVRSDPDAQRAVQAARRARALPDAELEQELADAQARAERLGLKVHPGRSG